ncbi:integrin alpha, partial [Halobacteriales archaeon Cl-PHB]
MTLLLVGLVALVGILFASGAASPGDGDDTATVQQVETAGFEGMIPLESADVKFLGEATNETAGWSVARAGDVNGDGYDDVIIGAPRNDSGASNAGAAYLVYGPADPSDVDLADADVTLLGAGEDDYAGWSVSTAGDLNADGNADIVVGAPGNDSTDQNAGAAYVVYGGDLSGEMSLAEADAVLRGSDAYDRAGWSVANVSAVGHDAEHGIAVGAPSEDTAADGAGAAYVVAASSLAGEMSLADADAKLTGVAAHAAAGWSVADAGDLNGDGHADIAVGAPQHNVSESQTDPAGAAYVVYGPVAGEMSLADANLTLVGANDGDRAGYAVSHAGDVNNDSTADLVVGAPYADDGGNQSGAAYVVYGEEGLSGEMNLSDANVTMAGEATQDRAGWSVSSAGSGDVTCDGIDDLIVGAPYNDSTASNAGAAYLIQGSPALSGEVNLTDADAKFVGEAQGDRAGWSVGEAGDHDGDGFEDVLIGAPYNDTGGHDSGAAYVVLSNCDEAKAEETPTATATATPTATQTATATATPTAT